MRRPGQPAYQEAHEHDRQADYEPLVIYADAAVDTCKLCGILVHRSWRQAHDRVHQADYEPLGAEGAGAGVDTCKLCGILVNRSYQEAHNRTHAKAG